MRPVRRFWLGCEIGGGTSRFRAFLRDLPEEGAFVSGRSVVRMLSPVWCFRRTLAFAVMMVAIGENELWENRREVTYDIEIWQMHGWFDDVTSG